MNENLSPIETVEIGDGDALEESDYEQRDVSTEIVEEREYVIAGAVRENDGEDATEPAQGGYRQMGNKQLLSNAPESIIDQTQI